MSVAPCFITKRFTGEEKGGPSHLEDSIQAFNYGTVVC
jgi:hypothetical protein